MNSQPGETSTPASAIPVAVNPREGVRAAPSLHELASTISASRLSCWQRCRLQFFFRYVQGLRKPPSPARHVGQVVHTVLQYWNLARWRGEPLSSEVLQEMFLQAWATTQDGVKIEWNEAGEEKEKQGAWALLEMYLRESPIPVDEKPEGVEVAVEADLSRLGLPRLVGVLDLVRAGGRIVDFKTSARTPVPQQSAHQHETQASIYGLLYREATGKKESAVELHTLVKTRQPKLVVIPLEPLNEQKCSRLMRVIESYQAGLGREDFVPSPGIQCSSCEFFAECRAWH